MNVHMATVLPAAVAAQHALAMHARRALVSMFAVGPCGSW